MIFSKGINFIFWKRVLILFINKKVFKIINNYEITVDRKRQWKGKEIS